MLKINGRQKYIKDIRTEIKYGATPADFASFFGVSEDEFMKQLQSRLGQTFNEYKRDLKKNESRRKRQTVKSEKNAETSAAMENAEKPSTAPSTPVNEKLEEQSISRAEELEAEIQSIAEKIAELRRDRVEKDKNVFQVKTSINKVRNDLEDLAHQIRISEEKLQMLSARHNEFVLHRQYIDAEIEKQEELLEKAKVELESYREVKLFCGSLRVRVEKEEYEPSQSDVEAKYVELSKSGKFDDYAIKHVRAAAYILCAVELLTVGEAKYSVEYDATMGPVQEIFLAAKNE